MCSYATEQGERVEPVATFQSGFSLSAEECLQWCREGRKDGLCHGGGGGRDTELIVAGHSALRIRRIRRIRRMLAGNAGVQPLLVFAPATTLLFAAGSLSSSTCAQLYYLSRRTNVGVARLALRLCKA